MKKLISFLSVWLFVAGASPAFAFKVNIWDVSKDFEQIKEWKTAQNGSVHVLEDFEDMDTGWYTEKETGVGTFTASGDSGLGGSSYNSSDDPYFSIQESDSFWYGRSNTTESADASQWLDSGDIEVLTLKIKDTSLKNLFFYIQDPADSGGTTSLYVNRTSQLDSRFKSKKDKASFFVGITLEEDDKAPLSSLTWITTSRGDGFGLDDFSTIQNPEPATMLLFGFGLIGIAGITRKFT